MAYITDRPDMEMLAMLHVLRGWVVETAGARTYPASTLAMALQIAEVQRGSQVQGIRSLDGGYRVSARQIVRLQEYRRSRGAAF